MQARWMAGLGVMVMWLGGAAAEDVNWHTAVPAASSGPSSAPAVAPQPMVNLGQPAPSRATES